MPAETPPRRGRPRRPSTDDQIADAALLLLRERGPAAVTMEAVAATSGVAKTTIYRRYRDRDDLMATVVQRITGQPLPSQDLSAGHKLRDVLARVRVVLDEGLGRGGVAALLTDSDPRFTAQFRQALATQLDPLLESIERDSADGVLRRDIDADILVTLLFGAYLGEVLRHGEPRRSWRDRTAAMLMAGLQPRDDRDD